MMGGYARNVSSERGYADSQWDARYRTPAYEVGARVHLNRTQHFMFEPAPLVVEVRGGSVAISGEQTRRSEVYRIDQPISLFFIKKFRRWDIVTSLSVLTQVSDIEEPRLEELAPGLLFIRFEPLDRRATSVLGNVIGRFRWGRVHLAAGVLSVPWLHLGDRDFKYEYQAHPQPYIGIDWRGTSSQVGGFTDAKRFSATYRQAIEGLTLGGQQPVQATVTYQTGLDRFSFNRVRVALTLPLSSYIESSIAYDRVWSGRDVLRRSDFEHWQKASILGDGQALNSTLPHQALQVGVRLVLQPKRSLWPLRLTSARLFQKHLFPAKRTFYTHNPVGVVEVYNTADDPVDVQLLVKTSGGVGSYRSEVVTIEAHRQKSIPFYLYLHGAPQTERIFPEQLEIAATVGEQTALLTTLPVTLYGPNAWPGHTWELKYFLTPEAPLIKQRAEQLYLRTRSQDATGVQTPFRHLQAFITALGAELSYVPDAVTTLLIDHVQYPEETLRKGSGDCEDLAVFLASSLMAVGIHTAVVDLRPRQGEPVLAPTAAPGAYGHVFLLVDTGIDAVLLDELGLNEFQGLTRSNATGINTIWIPLEPTVVDAGFARAFELGVQQYYEEVIVKGGVVAGNVQVYDF